MPSRPSLSHTHIDTAPSPSLAPPIGAHVPQEFTVIRHNVFTKLRPGSFSRSPRGFSPPFPNLLPPPQGSPPCSLPVTLLLTSILVPLDSTLPLTNRSSVPFLDCLCLPLCLPLGGGGRKGRRVSLTPPPGSWEPASSGVAAGPPQRRFQRQRGDPSPLLSPPTIQRTPPAHRWNNFWIPLGVALDSAAGFFRPASVHGDCMGGCLFSTPLTKVRETETTQAPTPVLG